MTKIDLKTFINTLKSTPENIDFEDTITAIDSNYAFEPTAFTNGDQANKAGENSGSCKIFAFAQLNKLSEAQTLACFGRFYRDDVLKNPDGEDHKNIRNFIEQGWNGISFSSNALSQQ